MTRWGNGRGGRPWRRKRDRILARDCYQCQHCKRLGFVTIADEVDHIVNAAKGGTDDDSNLEAICSDCHKRKTQQESGSYRERQAIGTDGWPMNMADGHRKSTKHDD